MVQVSIRTEEKRYKKFNIHGFKVKPWEKEVRLTFTKGEEVLHAICEEMQERGIETGKIFLTIYFEDKEIECGPMTVAITEEYPLLVDLVKQEMIQSMDETTTEEETKLFQRMLESIQEEVGVSRDDSTPIKKEDERIEQIVQEQEVELSNEVSMNGNTSEAQENSAEGTDEALELVMDEEHERSSSHSDETHDPSNRRLMTSYMAYTAPTLRSHQFSEVAENCSEEAVFTSFGLQERNELTALQTYQSHYLTKRLDEFGLKTKVKAFQAGIDETKVAVTKQLSTYYKEVHQDKPSTYADEHMEEACAGIKQTFNQNYFRFEAQQKAKLERFVKEMEEDKQKELEAFTAQLEQKYAQRFQEERQKKDEALVKHKETLQKALAQEEAVVYQALITEKMDERDQKLTDYKHQLEEQAQQDIEQASLNLMSQFEEIKHTLEKEVEEKSVEWQQLIIQEEQLAAQKQAEAERKKEKEHEQRMKEKELELKERDVLIKQKDLETPKTPEIHVLSMPATENQTVDNDPFLQQFLADKKQEDARRHARFTYGMIAFVSCAVIGVGGFVYSATHRTQAQLAQTQEQLRVVMNQAKEKPEETKETLDTLLNDHEFEKAFSKYTDAKSLNDAVSVGSKEKDVPIIPKREDPLYLTKGRIRSADSAVRHDHLPIETTRDKRNRIRRQMEADGALTNGAISVEKRGVEPVSSPPKSKSPLSSNGQEPPKTR